MIHSVSQFGTARRQTEPPSLWILLLAGSILLHGTSFFAIRLHLAQVGQTNSASPIAVELLDPIVAGQPDGKQTALSTTPKTAPTPSQPTVNLPRQTAPDSMQTAATSASSQPDAIGLPARQRPAAAEQIPTPAPRNPPPRSQSAPSTPSPPTQPKSSPSSPKPRPRKSDSPLEPVTTGIKLPTPDNLSSDIDTTTQPNQQGTNPITQPVAPGQGQGSGVRLTLVSWRSGNRGKDIPGRELSDRSAEPKITALDLPTVSYPASVRRNLRQSVRFLVRIDRSGKLIKVTDVLQGSSAEYDKLVMDLSQQLQFRPASQANQFVESLLEIELQLTAL